MPGSFTPAEIEKVQAKYPRLKLSSTGVLEGELDMHAQFGGEEIRDTFKVKITAFNPHSGRIPALYEMDGRVQEIAKKYGVKDTRDLHRNADGTSCLCVKQVEKEKYPDGSDLFTFVEDIAVPYLFWLSYYDAHGRAPWGDYSHGAFGLLEFYAEDIPLQTEENFADVFIAIRGDKNWKEYHKQIRKPSGERMCLCGSNKPFRKCHKKAYKGLLRMREELERFAVPLGSVFQQN